MVYKLLRILSSSYNVQVYLFSNITVHLTLLGYSWTMFSREFKAKQWCFNN